MTLLNTVSTPQIANENMIENTATKTVKLCASDHAGHDTLFFNSSNDSFI